MRNALAVVFALIALAPVGGCSRRHAQQSTGSQTASPQAPASQGSGGGLFSSCPQVPTESQVAAAIKSALNQIYGTDEGSARVTVTSIAPGADCDTFTVRYSASGTASNVPLSYEGGQWSVVLFKKHYPVQ